MVSSRIVPLFPLPVGSSPLSPNPFQSRVVVHGDQMHPVRSFMGGGQVFTRSEVNTSPVIPIFFGKKLLLGFVECCWDFSPLSEIRSCLAQEFMTRHPEMHQSYACG